MHKYKSTEDTICAQTTPPGHGGTAVVRISGRQAREICSQIIAFPENTQSHRAYLLNIYSKDRQRLIDEALVTYFQEPHSYTGEETVEISCHGNPLIVEEILQELLNSGARSAEKGEFTFRAFMSGKIDLLQAESVLSLIQSETPKAAETSLKLLKGNLSSKINEQKERLLWVLSHIEADIDFSMEGLNTIDATKSSEVIQEILKENKKLMESYRAGKLLTENMTVVLAGEPNAGKSSLFNVFVKKDKAIVTEHAGTTRDTLEDFISVSGIRIKIVDTAGLRETDNEIEKIGIQKTYEQATAAEHIFYVLDGTRGPVDIDSKFYEKFKNKLTILVNKTDIFYDEALIESLQQKYDTKPLPVSAKQELSLAHAVGILENITKQAFHETSALVLRARQYDLIKKAGESLKRALDLSLAEASAEFTAFELREALECYLELIGESFDDQVLEKIFQEFCVGK